MRSRAALCELLFCVRHTHVHGVFNGCKHSSCKLEHLTLNLSQVFECVVCDKMYKSEKALSNHEASKKHKEQLKQFKKMMHAEDAMHGLSVS